MKNATHPSTRPGLVLPAILLFAVAGCAEVEFRVGTPSSVRGGSAAGKGMGKIIRLDPRFDEIVPKGASIEKLAGGFAWSEGPVWLPKEEAVLFSDIPNSKLMQWSEKDGLSMFRKSEQANGNILDLQGRIISCQHAARNIIRIGKDGKAKVLTDKFDGKRFNSPNDVAVWKDGTLWFTDPPWGLRGPHEIPGHWVYKLDPKTGKEEVLIKDLAMPNGIVFSPDRSRLYVADTGGHKRHPDPKYHNYPDTVTCYAVSKKGKLAKGFK